MCFSKRDIVIFFAGAAAFHTISHIMLKFSSLLPLHMCCFTLTEHLNLLMIVASAALTAGLLWWAHKLEFHPPANR